MDPGVSVQNQNFTPRDLQNFLEPERKPKVFQNWQFFWIRPGIIARLHHTDRRLMGLLKEQCAEKEGTFVVLFQSGLNEHWWADSMECYTYLRNVTDLLSDGKTPYERRSGQPFERTDYSIWFIGWVSPNNCEGSVKNPSIWKEGLTWIVPRIRGEVEFGGVTYWSQTLRSWKRWTHRKSTRKDSMRKRWCSPKKENIKTLEEIRNWGHPSWYGLVQFKERVTLTFLENQKGLFHNLTTHFRMLVKRFTISGPCQEASYTAITLNPESNFTRREKNYSLLHWNALTYPEQHIRIWMSSKRSALMTTG